MANRPQCEPKAFIAMMKAAHKPARVPDCHPTRKHRAHGLCHSCYVTKWNKEHPEANCAGGWRKRNPGKIRAYSRRLCLSRVGTTLEEYEAMWRDQGGKCANACCSFEAPLDLPDFRQGLQVDHCHRTNVVRGLLCPRCNTALGHVDDDVSRLTGLIDYLGESGKAVEKIAC